MPDPSVRLSTSHAAAAGVSNAVPLTGTPANGELILFIVAWNETPAFATPSVSGFTLIASITSADWNPLYVFGKIASSEGTNPTYTCTFSSPAPDGGSIAAVLVIQNASASLPTNTASIHDTSASTSFSIPALTTTKAGSLDLVAVTQDGNNPKAGSTTFSAWGNSLAEIIDTSISDGYATLGIAAVTRATAGAQAATTVTSGVNDKNVALRIEIEPVASGTPDEVSLPLVASTTTTYAPSIAAAASLPFVVSTEAVYAPSMGGTLDLPLIASETTAYAPSLSVALAVGYISSQETVYALEVLEPATGSINTRALREAALLETVPMMAPDGTIDARDRAWQVGQYFAPTTSLMVTLSPVIVEMSALAATLTASGTATRTLSPVTVEVAPQLLDAQATGTATITLDPVVVEIDALSSSLVADGSVTVALTPVTVEVGPQDSSLAASGEVLVALQPVVTEIGVQSASLAATGTATISPLPVVIEVALLESILRGALAAITSTYDLRIRYQNYEGTLRWENNDATIEWKRYDDSLRWKNNDATFHWKQYDKSTKL